MAINLISTSSIAKKASTHIELSELEPLKISLKTTTKGPFYVSWISEGKEKGKVENIQIPATYGILVECAESLGQNLLTMIKPFSPSPLFLEEIEQNMEKGRSTEKNIQELSRNIIKNLQEKKLIPKTRLWAEEAVNKFFNELSKSLNIDIIVHQVQKTDPEKGASIESQNTYLIENPAHEVTLVIITDNRQHATKYSLGILSSESRLFAKRIYKMMQESDQTFSLRAGIKELLVQMTAFEGFQKYEERLSECLKRLGGNVNDSEIIITSTLNNDKKVSVARNEYAISKEIRQPIPPPAEKGNTVISSCAYCERNSINLISLFCDCKVHRDCVRKYVLYGKT